MKNKIILLIIIGYIEKVMLYCKDIANQSDFISDSMLVESCVFNLSQIGELSNKLDDTFTAEYPDIPWRALYGLRNRIVHDYDGVNMNLVWDIIHDDLPELIVKLKAT